jgi:hypothetical protein
MALIIQGSIVRGLYGILALLAPSVIVASVPGMSEDDLDDDARYFNRLFGGRDLLIAIATLAAARRGHGHTAVKVNLGCELTDSVSMVEEIRARRKLDRTTIIGALFNIAGYATWVRAARALKPAADPAPAADSATH